jgi:hypothetical protein
MWERCRGERCSSHRFHPLARSERRDKGVRQQARLPRVFHAAHPEVPWAQIVAMRNVLVHAYFGVDLNEVWRTVESDLPILKQQIEALIKSAPDAGWQ